MDGAALLLSTCVWIFCEDFARCGSQFSTQSLQRDASSPPRARAAGECDHSLLFLSF
jgi:hypothetical protein